MTDPVVELRALDRAEDVAARAVKKHHEQE